MGHLTKSLLNIRCYVSPSQLLSPNQRSTVAYLVIYLVICLIVCLEHAEHTEHMGEWIMVHKLFEMFL